MKTNRREYYDKLLLESGFKKVDCVKRFCNMGESWEISKELGEGYYWIYENKDLFNIKIHDFFYYSDMIVMEKIPKGLTITYYESISGEELMPYRRLEANIVKTFIGGEKPYKANIHKRIPVRSVGIEIFPEYYEDYLKKNFINDYRNPFNAFRSIDETSDFPQMVLLLNQIKNYKGKGISAKMFYNAKVEEAVALVIDFCKVLEDKKQINISDNDKILLESVVAYLNDHYAFNITLEELSKIACMGITKLKYSFKKMNGCTITEYIQRKRMSQAEHLLSCTDLTINQVAQTVGYKSASRFSELFKKSTGISPKVYRNILNS